MVIYIFFSLCLALSLIMVAKPSAITGLNVRYYKALLRLLGYRTELNPISPGYPERVARIWGIISAVVFLLLLAGGTYFGWTNLGKATTSMKLEEKVVELNNRSVKSLGVSLTTLNYLRDASPDYYIPLSVLEKTGDINFIRELENKGYITLQIVIGLPNGAEKNEKFLRITPIGRGVEIQKFLIALKPIKSYPLPDRVPPAH